LSIIGKAVDSREAENEVPGEAAKGVISKNGMMRHNQKCDESAQTADGDVVRST